MTTEISNCDNVIDSRDVIERIEELQGELNALQEAVDEAETDEDRDTAECELHDWQEDYGEELSSLKALQDEAEGYSDWRHGATLINDDYFTQYAEELAADLYGKEISEAQWPFSCINWDRAAEELQQDYTSVDFDGTTFWVRH